MNGFGKMFLLIFVSVACIMSRATEAKADVDNLEDLLEEVADYLGPDELAALVPRGIEMVNQLAEAVGDMSKRDHTLPETIIQTLIHAFTDKAQGGGGMLNPETLKPIITSVLRNILGEEMFKRIESLIAPAIDFCLMMFKMALSMSGSHTASTSTAAAVAARDVVQEMQGFLQDNFVY